MALGAVILGIVIWKGIQHLGYFEFQELTHTFRDALFKQPSLLPKRAQLRQLRGRLCQVDGDDSAWALLVDVCRTAGFDAGRVEASSRGGGVVIREYAQPGKEHKLRAEPDLFWSLTVPLASDGESLRVVWPRVMEGEQSYHMGEALLKALTSLPVLRLANLQPQQGALLDARNRKQN